MAQHKFCFRQIQSQKLNYFGNTSSFDHISSNNELFSSNNKKIVHIRKQNFLLQAQKISWRTQTQFPIVKVLHFQILTTHEHNVIRNGTFTGKNCQIPIKNSGVALNNERFSLRNGGITIQLTFEEIMTIENFSQIPLFKIIYLLKEALIGAERLCTQYGNFILKESMVGVNRSGKCKIWHNSKFQVNRVELPGLNEQDTVSSVIRVLMRKTKKSKKSQQLYKQLNKCKKFCASLQAIKIKSFELKIRTCSFFVTPTPFLSPIVSPRTFLTQPNSSLKNPESCQLIKRHKNFRDYEKLKKNAPQFCKSNYFRKGPVSQFSYSGTLSTNRNGSTTFQNQKINPKVLTYLNEDFQQIITIPRSLQSSQSYKIIELKEVDSIHEQDSEQDGNSVRGMPVIKTVEYKNSKVCNNLNLNHQLCISSLLINERQEQHEYFDDIAEFLNKNLQSTIDNTFSLAQRSLPKNMNSLFCTQIKQIDKSYDDGVKNNSYDI